MTHALILRHPVPAGIRTSTDAHPAARELAARIADVIGAPPGSFFTEALFSICLSSANGEDEVVLRFPGRIVQ